MEEEEEEELLEAQEGLCRREGERWVVGEEEEEIEEDAPGFGRRGLCT